MIFFETMPMEGKLIVLGILCIIWHIIYKYYNLFKSAKIYKLKFVFLHSYLGFIGGLVVGLVLSTFSGKIELQTKYSIIIGIVGMIILGIYSLMLNKEEKIEEVYKSDLDWAETGWVSLFAASIIMYCFIQAFKIPTGSMRMTLVEGDHLFVNKFIYGIRIPFTEKRILKLKNIKRRDIIIFNCPEKALSVEEREKHIQKDFIKRCVGLPGDKIEIKNKILYINDEPQNEPYVNFEDVENIFQTQKFYNTKEEYQRAWEQGRFTELPPIFVRDNFGPVIVPLGHYFVLGDNRDKSFDSRFWGPLEEKHIKGAPLIVYWPINRLGVRK